MWYRDISHEGLNKYRRVKGSTRDEVNAKAEAQLAQWDEAWNRRLQAFQRKAERELTVEVAMQATTRASEVILAIEGVLHQALGNEWGAAWWSERRKPPPIFAAPMPEQPDLQPSPIEPQTEDQQYRPALGVVDRFSAARRQKRLEEAKAKFAADHESWEKECRTVSEINCQAMNEYERDLQRWRRDRDDFNAARLSRTWEVQQEYERYCAGEPAAVAAVFVAIMLAARLPVPFDDEIAVAPSYLEYTLTAPLFLRDQADRDSGFVACADAEYVPATRTLVVDYGLPRVQHMPGVEEFRPKASDSTIKVIPLKDARRREMYDRYIYNLVLLLLHEIFASDTAMVIDSVAFNGWVEFTDPRTGKDAQACILSLSVAHDAFVAIDLARVAPAECFKSLKGLGSPKLHTMVPIAPVQTISREDKRFVPSREVIDRVDEGSNLATMDWEDFEHFIRELFEKEFSVDGGEVRITQASRDRGVDAIAFDPDPVRGGKIVIQAKRYSMTVGVEAVRDLYGTTINEGAMKGILVTTSDFGPDAHEFARNKPLTLLNGNHLLHLLAKHGHKARIDLDEARRLQADGRQWPR